MSTESNLGKSDGRSPSTKQRRLQYRMSLQVERNLVPTEVRGGVRVPKENSTTDLTQSAPVHTGPVITYDQLMESLNPPVPPPRESIQKSSSLDRSTSIPTIIPITPSTTSSIAKETSKERLKEKPKEKPKEKSKDKQKETQKETPKEKSQEFDPISASDWSRQQDTKRYAQTLKYVTALLQKLEQIYTTPIASQKKSHSIVDVSARCLGLCIPEERTSPGTLQLKWKHDISVQVQSNGNMALFYAIVNEKGKLEKHVRHYYLNDNGLVNGATDLNLCLTGHAPIRKFA